MAEPEGHEFGANELMIACEAEETEAVCIIYLIRFHRS